MAVMARSTAAGQRAAVLRVIDWLLGPGVPVHALGVHAHLAWRNFARQFNTNAYRSFLAEVAARGLTIMITEMDVLDDGLKANITTRDAGVARRLPPVPRRGTRRTSGQGRDDLRAL